MSVPSEPQSAGLILRPAGQNEFGSGPVELQSDCTEILQTGTLAEIREHRVLLAGHEVRLSELFEIQASPDTNSLADFVGEQRTIYWEGDFSHVHGIGRGWKAGQVVVQGNAGDCLGEQMKGGEIVVHGNAGMGTGRSMSGGRIVIAGNTGDFVGAPCPGILKGMTGGEIFITGTAGENLGERMRRGTIFVQGSTGRGVGREMLAGTILLGSSPTEPVGSGMKRGSIILLQGPISPAPFPGPLFDAAVEYEPVFVRVLLRYLAETAGFTEAETLLESSYRRYSGDMQEGGRGEILVRIGE